VDQNLEDHVIAEITALPNITQVARIVD
jgi:L-serine dehydratase